MQTRIRRFRGPCFGRNCLVAVCLVAAAATAAPPTDTVPGGSRLARPLERAPVFLTFAAGAGGYFAHDQGIPGYTVGLLLRPARAAELMHALFAQNTGLVIQVDVQGAGTDRKTISADLAFRRYWRDMRAVQAGSSFFWGLGVGLSRAEAPLPEGGSRSSEGFSFLGEFGVEVTPKPGLVLFLKAHYRHYQRDGFDYAGWSCHAGAGLPVPL